MTRLSNTQAATQPNMLALCHSVHQRTPQQARTVSSFSFQLQDWLSWGGARTENDLSDRPCLARVVHLRMREGTHHPPPLQGPAGVAKQEDTSHKVSGTQATAGAFSSTCRPDQTVHHGRAARQSQTVRLRAHSCRRKTTSIHKLSRFYFQSGQRAMKRRQQVEVGVKLKHAIMPATCFMKVSH